MYCMLYHKNVEMLFFFSADIHRCLNICLYLQGSAIWLNFFLWTTLIKFGVLLPSLPCAVLRWWWLHLAGADSTCALFQIYPKVTIIWFKEELLQILAWLAISSYVTPQSSLLINWFHFSCGIAFLYIFVHLCIS